MTDPQRISAFSPITEVAATDSLVIVDVPNVPGGTKKTDASNLNINFEITAAETAASVTPTDLRDDPGVYTRYRGSQTQVAGTNTVALQDALDSNTVVSLHTMSDEINAFTMNSENILEGHGQKSSVLKYQPTTGDCLTLKANSNRQQIVNLKLLAENGSTGFGITDTDIGGVRDFLFQHLEIEGFNTGIRIEQGFFGKLSDIRLLGPGTTETQVNDSFGVLFGEIGGASAVFDTELENVFPALYEKCFFMHRTESIVMTDCVYTLCDIGLDIFEGNVITQGGTWDGPWTSVASTLSGAEAAGQTSLSVTDETGFDDGALVWVALDNGNTHTSRVASTSAGVVVIDDGLDFASASGSRISSGQPMVNITGTKQVSINIPTGFISTFPSFSGTRVTDIEQFINATNVTARSSLTLITGVQATMPQDSLMLAGNFALSAGWGTTASVGSLGGSKNRGRFTVTSAGTGQAANPTITLTFRGTSRFLDDSFAVVARNGGDQPSVLPTWTTTTRTLVITFPGTPVAAETYTFEFIMQG